MRFISYSLTYEQLFDPKYKFILLDTSKNKRRSTRLGQAHLFIEFYGNEIGGRYYFYPETMDENIKVVYFFTDLKDFQLPSEISSCYLNYERGLCDVSKFVEFNDLEKEILMAKLFLFADSIQ